MLSDGHLILTEVVDFGQQLELYRVPVDSPVTFSALTDTGLVWSTHKFAGDTNETWYENLGNGITLNMIYNWSGTGTVLVALQTQAANIRAVGLELGSQQTIAHKEYGDWVLNEIPKFGDQLAECQRYFVRIGSNSAYRIVGTGTAYGNSNCGILVPLPVEMRTISAVSIVGQLTLRNKAGSEVVCSGVALDIIGAATAYLNCTASGLTLGASYDAFLNPGSYLSFSADL